MHSNIIRIVVITKRESQRHYHTTQVSIKKERIGGERIKVAKIESKKQRIEKKKKIVEWQACINRLILSLPLKAYSLLRTKDSFGTSHSNPFPQSG